jgi:hypothetical protein
MNAWQKYDSATCKGDVSNKFFIALGRNVLAVPHTDDAVMLNPSYPGARPVNDLPKYVPPDTTKGCSGNPLQLDGFAYLGWIDHMRRAGGIALQQTAKPDFFELIRLDDEDSEFASRDGEWSAPRWMGERLLFDLARYACDKAFIREELNNGLVACRVKPSITKYGMDKVQNWGASYVALPDVYKAPLGERFLVFCDPGLFSHPIGFCAVTYVFIQQVGIVYRFQPYLTPNAIPIDNYRWSEIGNAQSKSGAVP